MVGIVTFVNENNYGAVLQAYAMQEFLRNNGIESEFVNTELKKFTQKKESLYVKFVFLKKDMAFKKFRKKLKISYNDDLSKYTAIILGSDQIWNPKLTGNELQPIFFGIGAKQNIIAYACSCGNTKVMENHLDELQRYIKNITTISVREKSLKQYLDKKIQCKIDVVLDPVFLLTEKKWRQFIGKTALLYKDIYIFVYLLEDSFFITDAINELSVKYNLKVITLRNRKHYKNELSRIPDADPHKFLELLSNAEIIVSNSFHAFAFSYILKKKIALFRHSQFNERITDLMELLQLSPDMYYDIEKEIIDFNQNKYRDLIDDKVEISKKYLLEALKDIR